MTYKVKILSEAQMEIREIVEYLAKVLKSPQAATGFIDEFQNQVDLIRSDPGIFAVSRVAELAAKGYRVALIKNYVMLYAVRRDTVFVAHVFHQRQDYFRLI